VGSWWVEVGWLWRLVEAEEDEVERVEEE